MDIPKNIPNKEVIEEMIALYSKEAEFRFFINSCILKWDKVRPEMELIDCIIKSICNTWSISKQQLISDRKFVEPRSLLFYLVHKKVNLPYEIIGDMFGRVKGNVHSNAKQAEFMIIQNKNKSLVAANEQVDKDLVSFLIN